MKENLANELSPFNAFISYEAVCQRFTQKPVIAQGNGILECRLV